MTVGSHTERGTPRAPPTLTIPTFIAPAEVTAGMRGLGTPGGSIRQGEIYGGLLQTGTLDPLFLSLSRTFSLGVPWAVE